MTHAITELQSSIVSQLNADVELVSLIGANAIFDLPPKGKTGSYIIVVRHDLIDKSTDICPANDHRLQLRCWVGEPSRTNALLLAERVALVLGSSNLDTATQLITNVHLERTQTAIDLKSGRAHATLNFRILSEPTP